MRLITMNNICLNSIISSGINGFRNSGTLYGEKNISLLRSSYRLSPTIDATDISLLRSSYSIRKQIMLLLTFRSYRALFYRMLDRTTDISLLRSSYVALRPGFFIDISLLRSSHIVQDSALSIDMELLQGWRKDNLTQRMKAINYKP